MAKSPEHEIDDELFQEVYGKEYTGPMSARDGTKQPPLVATGKRPQPPGGRVDGEENEEEERDPNAVPTDFTSREAKAWEAKARATERNWKKRKEEEMICKICGVSGHFTQVLGLRKFVVTEGNGSVKGCPSTLGSNRKSAEFIERVPARDKHVRALFSERVVSKIEKDVGCKLKMDEKFIIVSGRDRLILAKGVEAVRKVIQDEEKGEKRGPSVHQNSRSKSPDDTHGSPRSRRTMSQRYHSSPRNPARPQPRMHSQEKVIEDHLREDLQQLSRGSRQAFDNDGSRGRSRSPRRFGYQSDGFSVYDGHKQNAEMHRTGNWDVDGRGADIHANHPYEFQAFPQNFEELDMEYRREAMELARQRNKEAEEERHKYHESIKELRDAYMKKLAVLRAAHAKQWDEFLRAEIQRRQEARQHMTESSYMSYPRAGFPEYERIAGASPYSNNMQADSRSRYPYSDNYSAPRPQDTYGEFQHQKRDDYGKPYYR